MHLLPAEHTFSDDEVAAFLLFVLERQKGSGEQAQTVGLVEEQGHLKKVAHQHLP